MSTSPDGTHAEMEGPAMDTCPIFTAVARDLQMDPELLLSAPEADAPAPGSTGPQALR